MNNLQCRKAYVRVNLDVDEEGTIIPMLIRWKDGRVFQIEQLKEQMPRQLQQGWGWRHPLHGHDQRKGVVPLS
ncbi:MAG: hypothetical protein V8S92_08860 [Oscillospiraceae bacterium]